VAAAIVALVLVLAGCSAPGQTKDYNEQTQSNFVDACRTANEQKKLTDEQAQTTCDCWYDAVSGDEGLSFDRFKQDDEAIREAIDKGEFNNDADFQRVAPSLYTIVTEQCQTPAGPQAS
jgi:hypothetical protein